MHKVWLIDKLAFKDNIFDDEDQEYRVVHTSTPGVLH